MEQASPARLYATLAGAALTVLGIAGFFCSASFGSPGDVGEALGTFATNGWDNVLHMLTGALGLLVAGFAARRYALVVGTLYCAIAVWGYLLGSGEAILGFLPVNSGDNLFHLIVGALGLAAAKATEQGSPAPSKT